MTPGLYTELFFLDEATALAAGHRPCGECRRADFLRFKSAFATAHADQDITATANIGVIDRLMHADRRTADGKQRTFMADIGDLPDGAMFTVDGRDAFLLWQGRLLRWSPAGYTRQDPLSAGQSVTVLTPQCSVRTLTAGYRPDVHPSAHG